MTAVLLAVDTTIGIILSSLSKGLKSVAAGIGYGLKELGKTFGSLLPGLLGTIANFVFRMAGQVISFLGKNAWLLILAVAAILIERVTKRDYCKCKNAQTQPNYEPDFVCFVTVTRDASRNGYILQVLCTRGVWVWLPCFRYAFLLHSNRCFVYWI